MNDERILAAVESKRAAALGTHRFVHEHPELSHEEHECSRHLADMLEQAGLEVDRGVAGMETAFRATLTGALPGPDGRARLPLRRRSGLPARRLDRAGALVRPRRDPRRSGRDRARLRRPARRAARHAVVFGCPADEIPAPLTVEVGGGKAVSRGRGPLGRDRRRALRAPRVRGHGLPAVALDATRPRVRHRSALADGRARGADRGDRSPRSRRSRKLPPADAIVEHIATRGRRRGRRRALRPRSTSCSAPTRRPGSTMLAAPLREALPGAVWYSDPVVCGLRPNDRVTQAVKDAVLVALVVAACRRRRRRCCLVVVVVAASSSSSSSSSRLHGVVVVGGGGGGGR